MIYDPAGVSNTAQYEQSSEGDWGRLLAGSSRQRPRPLENTTLTALVLLFLVAAEDKEKAFPASGSVINLVCELQQQRSGAAVDKAGRAALISRLSAALTGLRDELG